MGILPIPPETHNITRLFTCPTKNQDFQATLSVRTGASEMLLSVEVL